MRYQFKPSLLISLITFFTLIGLISLGTLQLNKAKEKQSLQEMINERRALPPLSLNMPFDEFAPYQIVQATGQYKTKDSILLDNVRYNGQQGVYLLTPFEVLASRAVIMVNRGWLPKEEAPAELPKFKTPKGIITIEGHLNHPNNKADTFKNTGTPLSATPPLWHFLDQTFFSQLHGYPLLPLMLHLKPGGQTSTYLSSRLPDEQIESSLIQDWQGYDAKSAAHLDYATRWYLLSLFGLAAYLFLSFTKIKKD